MKKIVFFMAILGALVLSTATSSKATTVRLYFKITVTNTCNSNWLGNYWVVLKLTYNGVPITTAVTNYNVQSGSCCSFDFDLKETAAGPDYGVQLVAASETGGGCSQTFGTFIG